MITEITQEMINLNALYNATKNDDTPQGKRLVAPGADLSGADLSGADLSGANLNSANLRYADLRYADLRYADLRYADLSGADLSGANLNSANLRYAKISGANLRYANLRYADLSSAKLRYAKISGANLSGANLSGVIGLLSASVYIADNFEKTTDGIIAYKCFDQHYTPGNDWVILPGSIIEEVVNFSRQSECGCGVNVGTHAYVTQHTNKTTVWKVLIRWEWLAGVCVPYATDGKIRCEKVELIESMSRDEFLAIGK